MTKIFIAIEKYCDLLSTLGVTSSNSDIIGSAENSNIVEPIVYYYDEYFNEHKTSMGEFLIQEAIIHKPEAVVVSYYPFKNDNRNISGEHLRYLSKNLKIKTILLFYDFAHKHIRELAIEMSQYVDKCVVMDTSNDLPDNFIPMWSPRDVRLFKPIEKNIPVSFIGSTVCYPDRRKTLGWLRSKIKIHVDGGQRENNLSIERYASAIGRSICTINFCRKSDGCIQTKGRIFEAISSKALLLEADNELIKYWLTPFIDYVPFTDDVDLLYKINYYLSHVEEREKIVESAYNKSRTNFSNKDWWATVLEKSGVNMTN